jgi:hypothetical protein
VEPKPDRKLEAIGALTFTIPAGALLTAAAMWNFYAGWAAITLVVTAALIFRPG